MSLGPDFFFFNLILLANAVTIYSLPPYGSEMLWNTEVLWNHSPSSCLAVLDL